MSSASAIAKTEAVTATRAEIVQTGRASVIVLPPSAPGEPTSTALVKMGNDGLVRWVRTDVQLSESLGHVYQMPTGKGQKTPNITALGYDFINRALGVSFFMPETVAAESDGGKRRNPQIDRDEHGVIRRVIIRCIGFGRNATGSWMAIDSTLYYDLEPILAQDALKKWRGWDRQANKPGPGADWGQLMSAENVPSKMREEPSRKCIPVPPGLVLCIKLQGDALDLVAEHAHRVRFATRNAETIVRRNVIKRFLGRTKLDASFCVSVVSWQQPDREHVDEIARLISDVKGGSFRIDDEPVKLESDIATTESVEEEAAALAGDTEEGGAHIIDTDAQPSEPAAAGRQPESGPLVGGQGMPTPPGYGPAGATPEQAQAAVEKGTVSGAVIEAREKVRNLWAELGGDKPTTDSGGRETDCWRACTGCGFESINEALGTPDAAWIGQLVSALEDIQLKRASATAQAKRSAAPETEPPPAADGGSPAMRPATAPPPAPPNETIAKGDPPPAGRLFTEDTGRAHGDPG